MQSDRSINEFKGKLFLWIQGGKIISSLIIFIIFTFVITDDRFSYVPKLNTFMLASGLIGMISYKFFDKKLKYVHFIFITLDYIALIGVIILAKQAFSTLFFWLACGLVITYYVTNFTYTAIISIVIFLFTLNWPYPFLTVADLDYSAYANGSFQPTFNYSVAILSLFLFYLAYVTERVRLQYRNDLEDTLVHLRSEESLAMNNPNSVFEYFPNEGLVARNDLAQRLLDEVDQTEIDALSNYASTVLDKNEQHQFPLDLAKGHFLINLVPIVEKVNVYLTDITTLIQAQEELKEKEQQNIAIIDAIPGFVSWVDRDLNYLGVNSKFSRFWDKSKEYFIGKELGTINDTENVVLRDMVTSLFEDNSKESIAKELEYDVGDKTYWNYVSINKYNDNKSAVLVSIDTTELKEAQALIEEEQKRSEANAKLAAFGEMSAGIAHEINNPLAVVKASITRLERLQKKEKLTDEHLLKMIETSYYGIDRIQKIISGLKNLARDGFNDDFELCYFKDIAGDSLILLGQKCKLLEVRLDIDFDEKLSFYCQQVQVSQVLVILINNSIDAIAELQTRWIKVDAQKQDDKVLITVIDSGQGIAVDLQNKIFDPFFTTKGVGRGTGLGLSLAAKIIKLHSGELLVGEKDGHTMFRIMLPVNPS